mgnify:CR=1 FL=1
MKTFLKPLSAAEEKFYLLQFQRGDPEAKNILIERNLRLVAHVAKKYQGCAESTRLLYVDAMTTNVDAYLEFMKGKEYEIQAATLMTDYEKQLEMAQREQKNCAILQ